MMIDEKPKANVPPPPPRRGRLALALGTPEAVQEAAAPTPNNAAKPSEEKLKDLNFKVDESFHAEFKTTATVRRMSMKEFLEACFQAWKDKHGGISRDLIE